TVLQRQRDAGRKGVHQAGNRGAFLGHLDKDLARLSVGIEADGDVAFVSGDRELVRQRRALFGQTMAHGSWRRVLILDFGNRLLAAGCWLGFAKAGTWKLGAG